MKNKFFILIAGLLLLLSGSCINSIDDNIKTGNIPMTFSVKEISSSSTKVTGNAFDSKDEIGLFATFTNTGLSGERYIDNLRLTCDGNANLIPDREIFYPEGNNPLDIVAYYPFETEGIEAGSSLLPISVQSNQSTKDNFSVSDFLIATVNEVKGSDEPIELEFEHKLAKVHLILSPAEDENIDDILEADPHIIATGFKTIAQYNFTSDTFQNPERAVDITPYGEWEKKNGKLQGKEFIVIPQSINSEQALVMEWNGRLYTCPMPEIDMKSNTICEISINAFQATSSTLSTATADIKEWEYQEEAESDTEYDLASIRTASLSFKNSNVYRVYYESKAVAEICKEYLLSDDFSLASQAIVVYPVENEKTNINQGIVLKLENEEKPIHGGYIEWNKTTNSFTYEEGKSEPIECFYIDQEGEIELEKPDKPANVNVSCYTLRDIRGGKLEIYPIVKIGTQYWMREDLRATDYRQTLNELNELQELSGEAGYITKYDSYFYTGEAIMAHELAPYGWKIPTTEDWEKLNQYIQRDASIIKSGTWKKVPDDDYISPALNLTGLNIVPRGVYTESEDGRTTLFNRESCAAYWIGGEEAQTLSDQAIMLLSNRNELITGKNKVSGKNYYVGLTIRCVME